MGIISELPILSIITFLPLVGVILIMLTNNELYTKVIAAGTTVTTFFITLLCLFVFDHQLPGFQLQEALPLLNGMMNYHVGVDGISFVLLLLTVLIMPFIIIASWNITKRITEYMISFLILETIMIGVFVALDIVLFYVFFEASLIPMFIIIGIWGGHDRAYATFKFFLYTFFGSVLMLIATLALIWNSGTTSIPLMLEQGFPLSLQMWAWLAFMMAFAVKMPMVPVHTWLPDAHVEAPTAGSVVLAAVLLKMGGYGLIRFLIPMFPAASDYFALPMMILSVVAILYASLVALAQEDIKKLIAYSSIAHMGYVSMGVFSLNQQGIEGAVFQMLSHGIVSAALFLCVGVLYDRMHTREIVAYGGVAHKMPWYAALFLVFALANLGLPGTSGFVGEFLTLLGAAQSNIWIAVFASIGIVISAVYTLSLFKRVVWGKIHNTHIAQLVDLDTREKSLLFALALLVIALGVVPNYLLQTPAASITSILERYHHGVAVSKTET